MWFTWRAFLDTEDTTSVTGYALITGVDYSDPHTAVVTFAKPYPSWRYLFDGLLPAHAFGGSTDISGHWNDSIPI